MEQRELSCAPEGEHGKSQAGRAPVSALFPQGCLVLGLGEQLPVRDGGGPAPGPRQWGNI